MSYGCSAIACRAKSTEASEGLAGLDLLKRRRFGYGALCIFLYVGAEVSIGSVIINYLSEERVLGQPESVIGWMIGLYWGGAMVGRFIGSYFLRIFSPGKILAFNATGAILLILISANGEGEVAAYSLLAVGLMNSIMFPTIFSLACEKAGTPARPMDRASSTSLSAEARSSRCFTASSPMLLAAILRRRW